MSTAVAASSSYDAIPYPSLAFPQTHPDRLATIAKLFGMRPPDTERARVLELGCAGGGNLLPMADALPEGTFVGIDASARQVADGQRIIAETGLKNVTIQQGDILDLGPELGQFDYIICHGVYSWVPRNVQDKILAICRDRLAPEGVAYVSYNTYPGWHMRGMIRDMMRYHAQQFAETRTRITQSRALLDFLVQSVPADNNPFSVLLKTELDLLRSQADPYLFHEHLNDCNEPLYFHQFVERAGSAGLQYLGDATISSMSARNFSPQVENTLRTVAGDVVQMEQYLDFLWCRTFRQTLLCHPAIALCRQLTAASTQGAFFSAAIRAEDPKADLRSSGPVKFVTQQGASVVASDPPMKAAFALLGRAWPIYVSFDELAAEAYGRSPGAPAASAAQTAREAELLGEGILRCVASGLVEMRVRAPQFARQVSQRPLATGLMRHQAREGNLVTSRRHDPVQITDLERFVLARLDGTATRDDLRARLTEAIRSGAMTVSNEDGSIATTARMDEIVGRSIDGSLGRIALSALLRG